MPLPWKKKKSGGGGTGGRISRLMADFQSPSKRGGSLVVETGFPTSLIDLFVKNRDRMKKSSKRSKREKQPQQQQGPNIEIEEEPTVTLVDDREVITRTASLGEEVDRASLNRSQTSAEEPDEEDRLILDGVDSEAVDPLEDLVDQRPDRLSSLFLAIPMVVILGLLAMFTKWLVIGATIAAFLLGFGEFILGAPVADSLKPCINGRASFRGLIRNAGSCRKSKPKIKPDLPSNHQSVSTGEIEVTVSKSEAAAEEQVGDGLNDHPKNAEVGGEEVVNKEQWGRRSKLRSKIMKKIVPKKIRNQKKGEGDGCRSRV